MVIPIFILFYQDQDSDPEFFHYSPPKCQQNTKLNQKFLLLLFQGTFTLIFKNKNLKNQCCRSGMFIPDPRSDFFSIPDPNCLHPGSRILIKEFKY
jgi:hypothetical protein